jgi:hypothetical protein
LVFAGGISSVVDVEEEDWFRISADATAGCECLLKYEVEDETIIESNISIRDKRALLHPCPFLMHFLSPFLNTPVFFLLQPVDLLYYFIPL